MGVRLDCSSVESATDSLAQLFRISPDEIRDRCKAYPVDWHHDELAPEDQIARTFGYRGAEGETQLPQPAEIRWFHATRVPLGTTFEDGLLPTLRAVELLWSALEEPGIRLIGRRRWTSYRRTLQESGGMLPEEFAAKNLIDGWGPFAFLVREAALSGRTDAVGGHKDFTRAPECLEYVFEDFERRFGKSLDAEYQTISGPCLVSFIQPGTHRGAVRAALCYVYYAAWDLGQATWCNACFSGDNKPVPRASIHSVEWL